MSFLGAIKNSPKRAFGKLRGKKPIPVLSSPTTRALAISPSKLGVSKPVHRPAAFFAGFDDFFAPTSFFRDPFFEDWMPVLRHDADANMVLRRSSPGYEINESESEYQIAIDVPGVKLADLNIQLEDDGRVLHVSGGRKITRGDEVTETKFEKHFTIGDNVDAVNMKANLSDGVLVVKAPKIKKAEPQPIKISITEGEAEVDVPLLEVEQKAA